MSSTTSLPNRADEHFDEAYFDLVEWDHIDKEWRARGYDYPSKDHMLRLLDVKRNLHPQRIFRLISVVKCEDWTDVTPDQEPAGVES